MGAYFSKKKGFTLVEILVVLAVIGMVILLGVSSYGVVRKKVKLDIAANSLQSTIVESRDKTRAGYYDDSSKDVSEATSICFGFVVKKGEFITPLITDYNRLAPKGAQCDSSKERELYVSEPEKEIVVKNIFFYGNELNEEVKVFFAPPDANVETKKPAIIQDKPELKIVIGYPDSDDDLNKREIVFNVLTGSVYSQTFVNHE